MKNQLKWGSVLSYVQMAANVIINLLFTPVMLRLLGTSEYGLYNTVSSTISMLSILNLGFNSGYIKYFTKYKSQEDEESVSKLNGLFLTIFLIIGFVAFLCGLFLSFNLDIVFKDGLTFEEYRTARVLMLLLTVNLAFSFPCSVFSTIISANERYIFLKATNTIRTICSPLITLPLLLMGYRSIAMVSVSVFLHLFVDVMYIFFAFAKLKVKVKFGRLEKGLFVSLFGYTVFIALNIIIDQVNWNIDKILLGRFKGTATVSVYSVGYILSTSYNLFSTAVSSVFTPRIHKMISASYDNISKIKENLSDLFTRVGRIQFLILGLVSSGIVFFGKQFITKFWAGNEYTESYYVALLLIIPVTVPLIQNLGIEIQRAQNKHRFRSVVYAIMAVINLIMSIILCQKYGAVGAAVGTAISLIVANGIVINIYYHKKCNINIIYFWKSIVSMLKGFVLPVIAGIVLQYTFDTSSLFGFGVSVLLYVIVYGLSMWMFVMNKYEKNLVVEPVKKFIKIK